MIDGEERDSNNKIQKINDVDLFLFIVHQQITHENIINKLKSRVKMDSLYFTDTYPLENKILYINYQIDQQE
jgi:hypothetical protein